MLAQATPTNHVEAETEEEIAEQLTADQDFKHHFVQCLICTSLSTFYRVYRGQTDPGFLPPLSTKSFDSIYSFMGRYPALCSLVLTTPLVYKSVRDYTAEQKQSNQDLDDGAPEAVHGL